ncbi:LysR family transcriptional regulator [Rhodococcus sp. NPDC058505]|uniref:LysR family transcriptional regulator n=1 Tax=unclassified Rhodococcus (in: high G+C Gram-positive bacteria) TaxID=192944 RepID=UPI003649A9FD
MELQQMRYVLAVAEERSFTRAAARCHVVQSALSHQIKALERELGVALFARNSRRVETTDAGEAFLAAARACLRSAERAAADAAAAAGQLRGTLTIGLIPTVTAVDIPAALGEFRRAHPGVRVTVREGASDVFVEAIADGSMDVAVLGLPGALARTGVGARVLASARHVAVVPVGHPLADRRSVRLADLADEVFVDFPEGSGGRAQSDLAFREAGLGRDIAFEVMSTGLMLGLVRNGLAVALLPPGVMPEGDDLRAVTVRDGPRRVEYLAWSDFNPSRAARAFVEVVSRPSPAPRPASGG